MSNQDPQGDPSRGDRTSESDELRTLGFRLREIQRLLAARVEQENRRLAAEGLEPVEESRFVSREEQPRDQSD